MSQDAAPYSVTVTSSEDEDVRFARILEDADGEPISTDDFEIEYALAQNGSNVHTLTVGNGLTYDDDTGSVTIDNGQLDAGEYEHALRLREISTGKYTLVFDGPVAIEQGAF